MAGLTPTQTTNSVGDYTFTLLLPGDFKVTISGTGFRSAEVPAVTIHVTETEVLTQSVPLGQRQQEGAGCRNRRGDSDAGGVVRTRAISELPLVTRSLTQILNLSAAVVMDVTKLLRRGGELWQRQHGLQFYPGGPCHQSGNVPTSATTDDETPPSVRQSPYRQVLVTRGERESS